MVLSLNRQDGDATMEGREKDPARLIEDPFRLKRAFLQSVQNKGTPTPRPLRVQNPFGSMLVKTKGIFQIASKTVLQAATR